MHAGSGAASTSFEQDYLLLDAAFFRYYACGAAEPVLTVWGITTEGNVPPCSAMDLNDTCSRDLGPEPRPTTSATGQIGLSLSYPR